MTADQSERPTTQQQIDEVRLVVVNRNAWLARRAEVIALGKSVPPDTGCTAATLPGLEAAVRTLEWVRDHADALREMAQVGDAA